MERTDFEQWKAKEVARLLALVETERRYYQEMVAAMPVGLVVLSEDRSIVSSNRAFRHTFGLRTEDLRRKTIDQVIPSERLIEKIRQAHLQGPQADLVIEGERRLRVAVVPIRNWEDETEVETMLMVEDLALIPGLQKAAPVVEPPAPPVEPEIPAVVEPVAVEEVLPPPPSPLVDADIPGVVWTADPETLAFTSVSDGAAQLLGYAPSFWVETADFFRDRIHPDDRAATMAFYESALSRAGDASAEYRALSSTGGEVWCRETIRVPDPQSGNRVLTGVITEIGRRKQLEEQLLTAQRNTALHNMASRLAHDLNNPLMIVTGYTEEMLHALSQQDPMRGDVEQILAATERIAALTSQLLNFTHRQANAGEPVDLGAVIADLKDRLTAAVGESATLEIKAPQSPVWAAADAEQLEEAILALVSSTREDAQDRSRVIIAWEKDTVAEHTAAQSLKPGVYARMLIHDDGRGLDASKRAAIFENILGKTPETAGPALARAYAMVREWGGDIAFFSEPFRGSTFAIYLPYHEPVEVEAPPVVEQITVVVEQAVEPVRETILVVEDEPGIRALVRKILRREQYNVLEAGSGEEALKIAETHLSEIQLLVTDVMLPGMSGRDLAEGLREKLAALKVLYVSGYTDDEAVRVGAFPPGSKFLQKPFTLGALVGKVREALDS